MKPLVGIVMGSASDWETVSRATATLEKLGIAHEVKVISAHRTPDQLVEYTETASERGLEVLIAAAGVPQLCLALLLQRHGCLY